MFPKSIKFLSIFAAEMKKAGAILLISLYGLGLVRPAMPLIEYYFKMEEYKAKCVNKARPQLHCEGRCHLMNKLKALHEDSSDPSPAPVRINFEDYPVALLTQKSLDHTGIDNPEKLYPSRHDSTVSTYITKIFHPPPGV